MMQPEIQQGIEMPIAKFHKGEYPFGFMKVADSFDAGEYTERRQTDMARVWARWIDKNDEAVGNDWAFASRKTKDGRLRIWRTQ